VEQKYRLPVPHKRAFVGKLKRAVEACEKRSQRLPAVGTGGAHEMQVGAAWPG
jgi:hypothetical protein